MNLIITNNEKFWFDILKWILIPFFVENISLEKERKSEEFLRICIRIFIYIAKKTWNLSTRYKRSIWFFFIYKTKGFFLIVEYIWRKKETQSRYRFSVDYHFSTEFHIFSYILHRLCWKQNNDKHKKNVR